MELPEKFKELRVFEEGLEVEGKPIYSRTEAEVHLFESKETREAQFRVDWHLVALPVIQEQSDTGPLQIFKTWLAHTVILAPIPILIGGESNEESLEPDKDGINFAEWISGLLSHFPAAYTDLVNFLKQMMPDIKDFVNEPAGKDAKNMVVRFKNKEDNATLSVCFMDLSDGEKCFFLCAVLLAANKYYGPFLCFWDEPDNYLSLSEIGTFVACLRREFNSSGQIIMTSHNPEAVRKFSNENTFILERRSHLEPAVVRPLSEIPVTGDLVDALIRGDVVNE